ncbi:MAG: hypothetical protein RL026_1824 [Pseudomonadota bacterium]|jgi:GPH family glycoside/pentoside/hexuronide:cation symporter
METTRLTSREKFGYALGDVASNFFWQMFAIFMAKFYTDVFMLGAATLGTMLLVTRVGDAFVDPVVGMLADRTRTRWGRFRPYLVWMALPMAATAVLAFTTPALEGDAKVVYAYVTLSLMMIAYSAINIPYSALLGVLTPDSAERTSASAWRFALALLPVFVIVNLTLPMAEAFGGADNPQRGWMLTMAVYSAAAVLLFVLTFFMTRERVEPAVQEPVSLRTDLGDLRRNLPWLVVSFVGIAALVHSNMRAAAGVYFFEQVVPGGSTWFGPVMTSGAVAFIAGVLVTTPLARRFGKRRLYIASMLATAAATASLYWVPVDNLPLVWASQVAVSLFAAPTAPLIWAMYADTADYSEWRSGRRATGLVFSAASFTQKVGWALGGAGVGWLLAFFNYQPGSVADPGTLHGITLMMSLIPAAAALLAALAMFLYPLDEQRVRAITSEIADRRAA